jgi:hypothetical protein
LSGRGLCDELITRPEESYRLCCVVVCDLETARMGAPYIYIYIYIYIYDISRLRVNCTAYSYIVLVIFELCFDLGVAIGSGRVLIVLAAFKRYF